MNLKSDCKNRQNTPVVKNSGLLLELSPRFLNKVVSRDCIQFEIIAIINFN